MKSQMVYNIIIVLGSNKSLRVYNILACAYGVSDGLQYIFFFLGPYKSQTVYFLPTT